MFIIIMFLHNSVIGISSVLCNQVCANVRRYTFAEGGSLHIHSAQVTDTGRYLCMATNQAGTQRKKVDLQVYGGC